jgi:hypothetical protein
MGKLKGAILLLIVFSAIYVGWELIPPYYHNYQFQDELDDIARRNSYLQKSDDDVRQLVIKKASSMDIPLKEDQITITRVADGLGITVHYQVHVDMIFHPMDLDFTTNSMNKRI